MPAFTVTENIALALDLQGPAARPQGPRRPDRRGVRALRARRRPRRPGAHLSIGERQRVEILKVLMAGARLVILDEPTSVLAPQEVDGLFAGRRRAPRDEGLSVVIITHKLARGPRHRRPGDGPARRQGRPARRRPGHADRRRAGRGDGRPRRSRRCPRTGRPLRTPASAVLELRRRRGRAATAADSPARRRPRRPRRRARRRRRRGRQRPAGAATRSRSACAPIAAGSVTHRRRAGAAGRTPRTAHRRARSGCPRTRSPTPSSPASTWRPHRARRPPALPKGPRHRLGEGPGPARRPRRGAPQLPDGRRATVGCRELSGGNIQRVMLARALGGRERAGRGGLPEPRPRHRHDPAHPGAAARAAGRRRRRRSLISEDLDELLELSRPHRRVCTRAQLAGIVEPAATDRYEIGRLMLGERGPGTSRPTRTGRPLEAAS